MNKQDTHNESIVLEDWAAPNTNEIKGGPTSQSKRTVVLQSSVAGGGAEVQTITVLGAASNHNETVAADEAKDDDVAETARLTDLAVSEEQRAEVVGGMQLRSKRSE